MPTAAHDAWMKSTLGIHVNAPGATLPAAGPDKQSQEFHSSYAAALGPIDGDLAYIDENAEDKVASPLNGRRVTLVGAYSAAAAKIDPADEAKGKPGIATALGSVKAVAAQIAAARKAAEKAFNDWQTRGPQAEEADAHIEEMVGWGHPKAPPLQPALEAVQKQVEARQYAPACTAFDKLKTQVQPVYDDYTRQKAAQAEYDPAHGTMAPRLDKAATCAFKTLEKQQAELAPAQAAMEKDAGAKDYVHALEKQKALGPKIDAYEQKLAELEAKKKAYEDELAQLQPKLDAAKAVDHPKLKPLQAELETLHAPMEQKATAEDFDGALTAAKDLGTKADAFDQAVKELERKKKEYEDALAQLQPRIDGAAKCEFKSLEPMQKTLDEARVAMEAKAKDEDYDAAKAGLDDLSKQLDQFEKARTEAEAKRKAYEDARKALDPKLQAAGAAPRTRSSRPTRRPSTTPCPSWKRPPPTRTTTTRRRPPPTWTASWTNTPPTPRRSTTRRSSSMRPTPRSNRTSRTSTPPAATSWRPCSRPS